MVNSVKMVSSVDFVSYGERAIIWMYDAVKKCRVRVSTSPVVNIISDMNNTLIGFITKSGTTYKIKKRVKTGFVDVESARVGNNLFCIVDGKPVCTTEVLWSSVSSHWCEIETKNSVYYQ